MPSLNKSLFLFSAEFPFGIKSETFLETEIKYLANAFDEIVIFPGSSGDKSMRALPPNVRVNMAVSNVNFSGGNKWNALFGNLGIAIRVILGEMSFRNFFLFIGSLKSMLDYLAQQIIVMKLLERDEEFNKEAIIYDYWFVDNTLALTMLKSKGDTRLMICRAHRFDLYDDASISYGVPFRKWKMSMIDELYLISDHGLKYARSKTKTEYQHKLKLSRLGVKGASVLPTIEKWDRKVMVSCSRMEDFKQVELIPQILKDLSGEVTWIHFGEGPMIDEVKRNIELLPGNIKVDLMGHKSNQEVLRFYELNQVDLFVSFSKSEGLPVSMMEAQSFGIPILAFPVGGVPEIVVNGVTGNLLQVGMGNHEILESLKATLEFNFDRTVIRDYFLQHFEASANYTNFIRQIGSVHTSK